MRGASLAEALRWRPGVEAGGWRGPTIEFEQTQRTIAVLRDVVQREVAP